MEPTNDRYQDEIRRVAHKALRAEVDSFEELCHACLGAYPGDILALVQDGPYAEEIEELLEFRSRRKDVSVFTDGPDPSPTDYEWRFTKASAIELAALIQAHGGNVLCIGTPTIYWALQGYPHEVVLVDRNPYLHELVNERTEHRVHVMDVHLQDLPYPKNHFDVVVFDAPWYMGHLHYWMSLANKHVKPNGMVFFPMLRQLTRPNAEKDREILRTYAASLGSVKEDVEVVYETPRFENEALTALGLGGLQEWRIADLVSIAIPSRKQAMHAPKPDNGAWEHFRFGSQVVALRIVGNTSDPIQASSPYGDGTFVSRSVSARAKERALINLRTSRNRVAVVEGSARIRTFLENLVQGTDSSRAIADIAKTPEETQSLRQILALIKH